MRRRAFIWPGAFQGWLAVGLGLASLAPWAGAATVPVTALVFTPEGSGLVCPGDRRLEVRSVPDAAVVRSIACDLARVNALAFAPHGRWLAVGGGVPGASGEFRLLSWPDGVERTRRTNHADVVTGLAWEATGGRLAVVSADHLGHVWTVTSNGAASASVTLRGHAGPVLGVGFAPAGGRVVTVSADRSVKVWSAVDGGLLRSFGQHTEAVLALAFRPESGTAPGAEAAAGAAWCATGGEDRTVRHWQPEIGRMVRIVRQHEGAVLALAWAPDGTALYSAGKEGVIRRLDGASDRIEATWAAQGDWILSLAVSPDGRTLASGDWSGRVRLRRLPDGP